MNRLVAVAAAAAAAVVAVALASVTAAVALLDEGRGSKGMLSSRTFYMQ